MKSSELWFIAVPAGGGWQVVCNLICSAGEEGKVYPILSVTLPGLAWHVPL